jgi:hypothetical protein
MKRREEDCEKRLEIMEEAYYHRKRQRERERQRRKGLFLLILLQHEQLCVPKKEGRGGEDRRERAGEREFQETTFRIFTFRFSL